MVESVLPESVHAEGYAILNADDRLVLNLRGIVTCNVAYFTMYPQNAWVQDHVKKGGLAAIYENGYITIRQGQRVYTLARAAEIRITFSGAADFNIQNILPAALAAFIQRIQPARTAEALKAFIPGPETIPGRMNVFDFNSFKIIVDYAHNPHGIKAIDSFIKSMPASVKVGVITGVGDRRDEDIRSLGMEAAGIFDELIIRPR